MKSAELRIGNLVYDAFGNYCKIDYVLICNVDAMKLKPIPLTEEILLKCGFGRNSSRTLNIFINDFCILEYDMDYKYPELISRGLKLGLSKKIEYLHQLQNLYFALTGEDLNIEL